MPGVCGQALVGPLELRGPDLLDLKPGSREFWLQPVGVNSISDCNYGIVQGPFVYYIYNSPGLVNKPLTLYFRKDDGELLMVRSDGEETRPGRWYHFVITWRDDEISLYRDGVRTARSFGVPLTTVHNGGGCETLVVGTGRWRLDEVRLYRRALEPEEAANTFHRYRDRSRLIAAVPRSLRWRARYHPSQERLFYRLAAKEPASTLAAVRLTLSDANGAVLQTIEHPFAAEEHILDLPPLTDGRYTLATAALSEDGTWSAGESFCFVRQRFSWEGNSQGITDEVHPPFEPVRVEDRAAAVVGRRYELGPLGLPSQIASAGGELLAWPSCPGADWPAPARLRSATTGGSSTRSSRQGAVSLTTRGGSVTLTPSIIRRRPMAPGHGSMRSSISPGGARDCGLSKSLAVYHEEMRGCDAWPEWAVFQDEWTTESDRYGRSELPDQVFSAGYETHGEPQTVTFPRSYQDFGCWIADQWLRRWVSLYWDNTYPYVSTNVHTTAAYAADDGRIRSCLIL